MAESIVVGTDGSDRAKVAVEEAVRLAWAQRGAKIAGAPEGTAKIWAAPAS
jgi:nucleotide-binding universal stress UspA family protein